MREIYATTRRRCLSKPQTPNPKPQTPNPNQVIHGATTGDQDAEENNIDSFDKAEKLTLKEALEKYRFRCPILKIHGCVEYPNSIVLSRKAYAAPCPPAQKNCNN